MNEGYKTIPASDRPEMVENREFTNSRKLFTKIMEDFTSSDFTVEEIKDAYNKRTSTSSGMSYGESHLNKLVTDGLLDYDKDKKTYSVNHANENVAKFAMGETA